MLRLIKGTGPRGQVRGMLVGEAGGAMEHALGRCFVGKAGQFLATYLQAAELHRTELWIDNLYPFWTGPKNPDPKPEEIAAEEWRLRATLKRVRPAVIGTLGRISTRWFLGDVDMETVHGRPCWSKKTAAVIVPCFHPAAGFYNPEAAKKSQDDIIQFSYYLRHPAEEREPPSIEIDEYYRPIYFGGACDTEGLEDEPWGWSYSNQKEWKRRGLEDGVAHGEVSRYKPGAKPPRFRGRIEYHNALHDLVIQRAMGIDTSEIDPGDTMLRAFVLQLEPQALKSLGFRHHGLRMTEFDELVRPHFDKLALAWFQDALAAEYPKHKPIPIADYTKRKWRLYRPQHVGKRITGVLRSYSKDPEKTRLEKCWAEIGWTKDAGDLTDQYQGQAMRVVKRPFPKLSIFCVPWKKARRYSGTDAVVTDLTVPVLDKMLDERGLRAVYEMDRRALRFVDRMQEVGMPVDLKRLGELEDDLEQRREQSRRAVQRVVEDRWFNPGSAPQVARWLYDYKKLPPLKLTKSKERGSTADEALQMLRGYYGDDPQVVDFLTHIQDYREADKYLGTFVRLIFQYVKKGKRGWRLHPNFRVTRVVSGRLSSHEPNVLATPTRTDLGKRIRECFRAAPGWVIVSCDMSQIELRTMGHHCLDRRMRQAFENDEDLHAITAAILFKLPLAQIAKSSPERYVAKTINFAVMYGISAQALLEQLYKAGIFVYTLHDCARFIKDWFKIYGSVLQFLERTWAGAVKDGFVRDMWGRICYVPNIRISTDKQTKEAAQRLAGNFPIQSGAHGLVKRAEIALLEYLEKEHLMELALPWIQMHDELDLEVEESKVPQVKEALERIMVQDQELMRVPIKAEAGVGMSWADAK